VATSLRHLTRQWGPYEDVTLYLSRCQVDTPDRVVRAVWKLILDRRRQIGKVVDFGAGDGRFSKGGRYALYLGYEIDSGRSDARALSANAALIHRCAFSTRVTDADLCLGNPPYVRNQDLPEGWRVRAADVIRRRTGVELSGLANAWQYFALLALASTKPTGLVALVIPYEWISRPSAKPLRDYIIARGWDVAAYRLRDETFHRVLTTSSIAIVDKRGTAGKWRYFEETQTGEYRSLGSPTGDRKGVIAYSRPSEESGVFPRRGLSPGTQEVLVLTEGERVHHGLQIDVDVAACVTSLRGVPSRCSALSEAVFRRTYRDAGEKCWLLRTDREPSTRLRAYLKQVPRAKRMTRTCEEREEWWRFTMPLPPSLLIASGFRQSRPKVVRNDVNAIAVGSVSGIFGLSRLAARRVVASVQAADFSTRIVTHSNGLRKLEIGQLQSFLTGVLSDLSQRRR